MSSEIDNLTRKMIDERISILVELQRKSDRSTVILGAEFLNHYLAQLIRQFSVNSQYCDTILLDDGNPLSGFQTRIHTAYLLGLISSNEYHDLLQISKIRTNIANNMENMSFKDQSLYEMIRSLKIPRMVMRVDEEPSIRQNFEFTIAILAQHLKWRATEGRMDRRTPPDELILVDLDE